MRKLCKATDRAGLSGQLQWGRNFIVAEISPPQSSQCDFFAASMGPQLYRCGNMVVDDAHEFASKRFNGAATLSLRKFVKHYPGAVLSHSFNGAATLSLRKSADHRQCLVVELRCFNGAATLSLRKSLSHDSNSSGVNSLQWGRNFIVAEIKPRAILNYAAVACFNGAATLSLRKCRCP